MLIYHPAFDIYNGIHRMLQLLHYMKQAEVEVDRLRIWDFYMAFPRETRHIVFPRDLSKLKNVFDRKTQNPYEDLIDSRRAIDRMKSYQLAALKCLASYGFIDSEALANGTVKRTKKELPAELAKDIEELSTEKSNVLKLVTGFWELPLLGKNGLKDRTGLIDYKYDTN